MVGTLVHQAEAFAVKGEATTAPATSGLTALDALAATSLERLDEVEPLPAFLDGPASGVHSREAELLPEFQGEVARAHLVSDVDAVEDAELVIAECRRGPALSIIHRMARAGFEPATSDV